MIETKRLRCEPLRVEHADIMYPVLLDSRIYTYLPEKPPASKDALKERFDFLSVGVSPDKAERWLNWMLFIRITGEPIGFYQATVRKNDCSFAYVVNPNFWRRGYATEAGDAIITYLFKEYDIPSVTAEIEARNDASIALVKRLGFSFVRHDHDCNDDVYEVTRKQWFALRVPSGPQ